MSDNVVTAFYATFVAKARQLAMPVRMLEEVKKGYTFDSGDKNETSPWTNSIAFQPSVMQTAATLSFSKPLGKAPAVGSIYHEATHAWLDLFENDNEVTKVQKAAEDYYGKSTLTDGSKVDDATRVFTEAAASYVGVRMAAWFGSMNVLTVELESFADPAYKPDKKIAVRVIKEAKTEYNKAMADRMYGYQDVRDKGWTLSKHQQEVNAPMHAGLKQLCDIRILEGQLSEAFDNDQRLAALWKALLARYPEIAA